VTEELLRGDVARPLVGRTVIVIGILGARCIARPLVRCAVVVAGDYFVIVVAGFVIAGFMVVGVLASLMVVAAVVTCVLTLLVAGFARAAIVAPAGSAVAPFAVTTIMVVGAFAAIAAALATVMIATLTAIGKGLGHSELDPVVEVERQRRREAERQSRHGGGLQQPVQARLPGLIGGKLLA
jgi:hypothetical protein